jgi:hypothetical protein
MFFKHTLAALVLSLLAVAPASAFPIYTPGTWKNITPSGMTDFGCSFVEVDQGNPSIIYTIAGTGKGLWKSTNGGETWTQTGNPGYVYNGGLHTEYLDSPCWFRVDPSNSNHLYATQGVRGNTMGFWVSTNGGASWDIPAAFTATNTTRDVTILVVDPQDFKHVLVSSHSEWTLLGTSSAGILETRDGGVTWIVHMPLPGWTQRQNMGLAFLDDPTGKTWIATSETYGYWRTTDAGVNWTKVSSADGAHACPQTYRAKNGNYYCSTSSRIIRSTNNGVTWTQLDGASGLPGWYYGGLYGDGDYLYTCPSYANTEPTGSGIGPQPFFVSPESDGLHWTAYKPTTAAAQTFNNGPAYMMFDSMNRIMYAANWGFGLWALKVVDPVTATAPIARAAKRTAAYTKSAISLSKNGLAVRTGAGKLCDVKGRNIRGN